MILVVRRYAILVSVLVLAFGAASCGSSGHRTSATVIVLGSKHAYGGPGFGGNWLPGWGTPHPRLIYNGGDPTGRAWHIHWRHWGDPVAHGLGLNWGMRPNGGWIRKPVQLELRAVSIKTCGHSRAYTRLWVRAAIRPHGRFSGWVLWGGRHNLCLRPNAPGA
jgi:hypothetical protein